MTEKELKVLCDNFDSKDAVQFQKILLSFSKFAKFDGFVEELQDEYGVDPPSLKRWVEGKATPYAAVSESIVSIIYNLLE